MSVERQQIVILLIDGAYQYTKDLLALEAIHTTPLVPGSPVSGNLPLLRWDCYLQSRPDRDFAEFLCRGINQGFKIGFNCSHMLCPPNRNHESLVENPGHIQRYNTLMIRCRQDASDHYQRVLMLTGAPSAWFQRTTNLVSSG